MNGDKFYEVFMSHNLVMPIIFSLLVKHIETSKDCSKIVANIAFDGFYFPFDLTKKPGIIEEGVLETDSLKFTKYQLSNKYNSKIKFSILYKHEYEKIRNVNVKYSGLIHCKFIEPKPELYDFELSEQLKKKV
uniref:Uncharacterized protein n=1 Tax=Meloidogyne hapla TaxID=6305 RepID=A0A1I8B0U9_MELHA